MRNTIEEKVYEKICRSCPNAVMCHETREECTDYIEAIEAINTAKRDYYEIFEEKFGPKYEKYDDVESMPEEVMREFIQDKFEAYEEAGFCETAIMDHSDYEKYNNQPFKIVRRLTEEDCDLECLPMWRIEFNDGFQVDVYADEICPCYR